MTSKSLKNLFVKNLRSPLSIPIALKLSAWFGFTVDHAHACRISSFFDICHMLVYTTPTLVLPTEYVHKISNSGLM